MKVVTLDFWGYTQAFSIVVEPWGCDFRINVGETCSVVISNKSSTPIVSTALVDGVIVVLVDDHGSTFKFVRHGAVELDMPIPTP